MIIKAKLKIMIKCGDCGHSGTMTTWFKSDNLTGREATKFHIKCLCCREAIGTITLEDCKVYYVWKMHLSKHQLEYTEEEIIVLP